jgi:hypothetical protein
VFICNRISSRQAQQIQRKHTKNANCLKILEGQRWSSRSFGSTHISTGVWMQGLRNCFGVFARSICKCLFQSFSHFAAAPCILMRHGPFPSGLLPTCIRWFLRALISVSDSKGNQMDMQIFFQILSKLLFARALPGIYKLTVRVGRVDRLGRAIQNRALPARQHFDALVSRDAAREGHVRWSHKHTHTCVHEYMYVHISMIYRYQIIVYCHVVIVYRCLYQPQIMK